MIYLSLRHNSGRDEYRIALEKENGDVIVPLTTNTLDAEFPILRRWSLCIKFFTNVIVGMRHAKRILETGK